MGIKLIHAHLLTFAVVILTETGALLFMMLYFMDNFISLFVTLQSNCQ